MGSRIRVDNLRYSGIVGTPAAATPTPASSAGGGGGGGSALTSEIWKNTHILASKQFADGYTKEVGERERFRVVINNMLYYVGVVSVSIESATIEVSAPSQQAVLKIGETKRFEVTGDEYYDIKVTLNSINNGKASITIIKISEKADVSVTAPAPSAPEAAPPEEIVLQEAKRTVNIIYPLIVILISLALLVLLVYPAPNLINMIRERGVVIYERPQRRLTAPAERYIRKVRERVAEQESLVARRIKRIPGRVAEDIEENLAYPADRAIRRFGEKEVEIAERLERVPAIIEGKTRGILSRVSDLLKRSDRAIYNKLNLASANITRVSENVKNSIAEVILLNTQRIRRKEKKFEGELGELASTIGKREREIARKIKGEHRTLAKQFGRDTGRLVSPIADTINQYIEREEERKLLDDYYRQEKESIRKTEHPFEVAAARAEYALTKPISVLRGNLKEKARPIRNFIRRIGRKEKEFEEDLSKNGGKLAKTIEHIPEKTEENILHPAKKFLRKMIREEKNLSEEISKTEGQIAKETRITLLYPIESFAGRLIRKERKLAGEMKEANRLLAERVKDQIALQKGKIGYRFREGKYVLSEKLREEKERLGIREKELAESIREAPTEVAEGAKEAVVSPIVKAAAEEREIKVREVHPVRNFIRRIGRRLGRREEEFEESLSSIEKAIFKEIKEEYSRLVESISRFARRVGRREGEIEEKLRQIHPVRKIGREIGKAGEEFEEGMREKQSRFVEGVKDQFTLQKGKIGYRFREGKYVLSEKLREEKERLGIREKELAERLDKAERNIAKDIRKGYNLFDKRLREVPGEIGKEIKGNIVHPAEKFIEQAVSQERKLAERVRKVQPISRLKEKIKMTIMPVLDKLAIRSREKRIIIFNKVKDVSDKLTEKEQPISTSLKRKSVFTESGEYVGHVSDLAISNGATYGIKVLVDKIYRGVGYEMTIKNEDISSISGPVVIIKKEAIGK